MSNTSETAERAPAVPDRSVQELVRAAVSGWLGTALEYVDFQLYSLAAAIVFPLVFFPSHGHPALGMILAMATYGVGYVSRPLGAWFFGRMGDTKGRKNVLVITILLMGGASTLIGLLPTYEQAGILAPALLVLLRLVQGFGSGAEISGTGVMLTEYAPTHRRGLIGSLTALGTNSGTLLASGIWAILLAVVGQDEVVRFWWRVPFVLSFLLLALAVWIRKHLKESPIFEALQEEEAQAEGAVDLDAFVPEQQETPARAAARSSVKTATGVKQERKRGPITKAVIFAFLLRFGEAGNNGIIQTYMVTFITAILGMSAGVSTRAIIYSSLIAFITVPAVGYLGDVVGRRRMYIIICTLGLIAIVPCMLLIVSTDILKASIAFVVLHNLCGMAQFSLQNVTISELLGSRNRFTTFAIARELASILAAGIGPTIAASLVAWATGSWIPVALLLVFFTSAPLIASICMPDPTGRDLTDPNDAC